jgi:hypothetical protein
MPRLGVEDLGVAEAGVLAPLQGVLQPGGLSVPPVAAAMALDRAALRLNSMLLLLGMAIARPCSSRVTTVMLSVESSRCARSTSAFAAVSATLLRDRARRVAATACRSANTTTRQNKHTAVRHADKTGAPRYDSKE